MPKEFNVNDLLTKLSANSFLIVTPESKLQVTPGVFLGMPGKFFAFSDVLDAVLKTMYVNDNGNTVVDFETFQKNLKPLDMNEYFGKLESTIKVKDILGINETPAPAQTETPQPQTPQIQEVQQPQTEQTQKTNSSANGKSSTYGKRRYYNRGNYSKRSYKSYPKKSGTK